MQNSSLVVLSLALTCVLAVPLTGETPSAGAPVQPRVSYSRDTVVKKGVDVVLDCGVEGIDLSNLDQFRIDWSKIDEEKPVQSLPISSGETVIYKSTLDKYKIIKEDYTYSLQINNVDEEDVGLYRCLVYFSEDQFVTPKINLDLETAPFFTDPSTKEIVVTEGDNISLDCKPGGKPEPEAIWEKVVAGPALYSGILKSNQLNIPSVSVNDAGRYACHADNGVGEPARTEIEITVQYAPRVTMEVPDTGAELNKEFSIECRAEGYPAPVVSWYKDGFELLGDVNLKISNKEAPVEDIPISGYGTKVPQLVTSTILVKSVNIDVLGEYSCSATNEVETIKVNAEIRLKKPPKIEKQSNRRVFYNDEKSPARNSLPVAIECEASGTPAPKYRWTKNNEPLVWQSDPRYDLEPLSGTLLISNPTLEDNGWYQCFAYNELGVAKSDPVYLFNATRVDFDVSGQESEELVAEEGRPFKMICPNATSDPTPTVTWVIASPPKDGQSQMEFFSSNRTVVGPDGTAYFTHVIAEDDSENSGVTYMCVGMNAATPQDFSIGTTVRLKVVPPEDGIANGNEENVNIEPFLVYGSNNKTNFKGGKDNKLWCIFGGEPEPLIVWTDTKGKPLEGPDYAYDNYNSTLIIKNTNISHEGVYTCIASNTVGIISRHVMNVSVEMPPTLRNEMESLQVEEGTVVNLFCGAEGTGTMTFTWTYNGREISSLNQRIRMSGSQLIIKPAIVTDTGNYACNVTSKYGYAYGQGTLLVTPSTNPNVPSFNPETGCPEVSSLEEELKSVRATVQSLQKYIQEINTAQADATISLVQRIAERLNILTDEELSLISAQQTFREQNMNLKTIGSVPIKGEQKPNIVRAEQKQPSQGGEDQGASVEPSTEVDSAGTDAAQEDANSNQDTSASAVKSSDGQSDVENTGAGDTAEAAEEQTSAEEVSTEKNTDAVVVEKAADTTVVEDETTETTEASTGEGAQTEGETQAQ